MDIIKKIISEILTLAIFILGGGFLLLWYLKRKGLRSTADSLVEKEEYEAAIEEYKKELEKYPENYNLNCSIGYAYRMLGDNVNAIVFYEKAMNIDPAIYADTFAELGRAYAENPETFDDAIALYNQVCKEFEGDQSNWEGLQPNFIEIMGWISLKKGDMKKAEEYYDQAFPMWEVHFKKYEKAYSPGFAELHYHFGVFFTHKGEKEKARTELKKAIKYPLKNIFAKKANEALLNCGGLTPTLH